MNELRPVSSVNYAIVDDPEKEFFDKHAAAYKRFDFVSPLLALMRAVRSKTNLSAKEKQDWVLFMHAAMVERAEYDENEKRMALSSVSPLIEVLLNVSQRNTILVRDSMSFYRYIKHDQDYRLDIDFFLEKAIEQTKEEIGKKSGISLLEIIRDVQFMYIRAHTVEELCGMALKKIDWSSEEIDLFEKLLPFLLTGFANAEYVTLGFSDRIEPKDSFFCCKIC
ncbi:MAG: hypothetical protein K1X28_00295 [Parachlamydiales bacterium]|nr:hypothetical protein [Parachlamydiales bacterium]